MLTYAELLERKDAPPGCSWGLFGADDEIGTINFLTPDRVVAAAQCVRRGAIFNLDCSVNAFDPPLLRHRHAARHTIFGNSPHHRDDRLDSFFLQGTSQIDGLRHFRHPVHGFYNFTSDASVSVGSPRIGINRWAEHGIVGRGVVVDVERYLRSIGKSIDHQAGESIPVEVVDAAAASQGVAFKPGDILLLRTGWMRFYFDELQTNAQDEPTQHVRSTGLLQSHGTLAWIWDHQFALCAADNIGLESFPPHPSSPFAKEVSAAGGVLPAHEGLMHPFMIALLGLAVGELWALDALAEDCANDGIWECLVTAKPLNLIGGVGSTANALAVK